MSAQIDLEAVQKTLRALHGQQPYDGPLTELRLVENILTAGQFAASHSGRVNALYHMLAQRIIAGLSHERRVFGLVPPVPNAALEVVQAAIDWDGHTHNPALIGWSWLYYGYVRAELGISTPQFCRWSRIEAHTMQRYQRRALIRLTRQLIADERHARKHHH